MSRFRRHDPTYSPGFKVTLAILQYQDENRTADTTILNPGKAVILAADLPGGSRIMENFVLETP